MKHIKYVRIICPLIRKKIYSHFLKILFFFILHLCFMSTNVSAEIKVAFVLLCSR